MIFYGKMFLSSADKIPIRTNMKAVLCLVFFLFSFFAQAQMSYRLLTAKEIVEKKKKAILLIKTYKPNGEIVSSGSGFFVSSDGYFITNYHVLKKYLASNDYKISVTNSEGRDYDVLLGDCQNKKKIDLCAGRALGVEGGTFLGLSSENIGSGHTVFSVSNGGNDFISKSGEIVEIIKSYQGNPDANVGVKMLHTNFSLVGGDSGGGVFSTNGELVGIHTAAIIGRNDSLAISAEEVASFFEVAKYHGFKPVRKR